MELMPADFGGGGDDDDDDDDGMRGVKSATVGSKSSVTTLTLHLRCAVPRRARGWCVVGGATNPGGRGRLCRAALAAVPSACALIVVAGADVLHFPMLDDDAASGPVSCPVVRPLACLCVWMPSFASESIASSSQSHITRMMSTFWRA
jgi:hypothetical protein